MRSRVWGDMAGYEGSVTPAIGLRNCGTGGHDLHWGPGRGVRLLLGNCGNPFLVGKLAASGCLGPRLLLLLYSGSCWVVRTTRGYGGGMGEWDGGLELGRGNRGLDVGMMASLGLGRLLRG